MSRPCWVNVYTGLYAECTDGAPYYVSPAGHHTKREALEALDSPKAKGIRERFIATMLIDLPEILISKVVHIVVERMLFGELQPVFRENEKLMVWDTDKGATRYLRQVIRKNKKHKYEMNNFIVLAAALIGEKIICEYDGRTYEMNRTDEHWKTTKTNASN